jgi:diaminohydroxyphosphoribosylaminopyrimidine deaminase/5-amino-6-(5-phosphoribosylamino)uracil reductase
MSVPPNPPVGSVLVWEDQIIGEGFHQACGEAHAEVNAINSVSEADRDKISRSTLYVSLEPCNHYGRTPPCTELILKSGIPRVVIGARDPFITENGGGMEYLIERGVKVDILDNYPCSELLNFRESVSEERPRIILKYAVSKNGYIGMDHQQIHLSNELSQRWVHALRSQTQAIVVGTNTIVTDNPRLNNRKFFGTPPVVIVPDRMARLKGSEYIFSARSILYLTLIDTIPAENIVNNPNVRILSVSDWSLKGLLSLLYGEGIRSIFVEGGKKLMEAFIKASCWDACYEIKTTSELKKGIKAPDFESRSMEHSWKVGNDDWIYYLPVKS